MVRLVKSDITRYTKTSSNRFVVAIALMLGAVAKEDARDGLSREFGTLTRFYKHVASTAKDTKMSVTWRM